MTGRGRLVAAAALTLLWLGSGCFVIKQRLPADEPLPAARIGAIRAGATTRREILEWFGPPTGIARRGAVMVYPAPGVAMRGRVDIRSDAVFELFSAGRTPRASDIVYYYDSACVKGLGILFIPIVGGGGYTREVAVERLWILIDENTGLVEGHVFRGAG